MKRCIILAFLLPLATWVVAQQPSISADVKKKLAELNRPYTVPQANRALVKILPSLDTGKVDLYRKLLDAQRLQQGGLVKGTYSHTTGRGKVYTLTPDNMPCLVPDMKSVIPMPNAGGVIMNDRLKPLPRQPRIIPQDDGKKKK